MELTILEKGKKFLADVFIKPGHWDPARFLNTIGYFTGFFQSVKVVVGFVTTLASGKSFFTKRPVKGYRSVPATILVM